MTAAEMYRRALDVVRERGWTQGTFLDDEGRVCLLGACGMVLMSPADRALLRDVLEEHYGDRDIPGVNDRLMTSQSEAEAMLEKAALKAEEQGR